MGPTQSTPKPRLPRHPDAHVGLALRGYARFPAGPGRLDIRFVPGRLWPSYGWLFTGGDGHANVRVGTFDATTRPNRRELEALLSRLFPDVQFERTVSEPTGWHCRAHVRC